MSIAFMRTGLMLEWLFAGESVALWLIPGGRSAPPVCPPSVWSLRRAHAARVPAERLVVAPARTLLV
jgi:hypothetical protein